MEKTFKQSTANLIRPLWGVMAALLTLVAATSCNNSSQGVEESINDAAIAITDGDWNHAQATCNHLLKTITGPDSTIVTEQQAARLGILFMKLSEQQREYDRGSLDGSIYWVWRRSKDCWRGSERHNNCLGRACK